MSKTRKLVLLVVEGIIDMVSLELIVPKLVLCNDVRFAITNGDITSDLSVTVQNVKEKLRKIIQRYMDQYRLNQTDLIRVAHIVDTDGAFVSDSNVVWNPDERLLYLPDRIETSDVQGLVRRNRHKTQLLNMLVSTPEIFRKRYDVYYFSRNIEHVLNDKAGELSNDEKMRLAEENSDRYCNSPAKFLEFISDPTIAAPGDYNETWDFVKEGTNSLHRYNNFYTFFDGSLGVSASLT